MQTYDQLPYDRRRCPACLHVAGTSPDPKGVYTCRKCGGIFADNIYLGESYEYVLPHLETEDVAPEETRYFDFTCLSSKGIVRRHGWYNTVTRRIVQIG
jgi:ribosomal protein L37AE/L43A